MAAKSVTNGGHHTVSPSARYPHSALESTMTRTFYPKYASYMGDGSGRDSYVVVNNGGLANNDKRFMMWRPNKVPKKVDPKPYKLAAAVNYRSDGTGRDSYVVSNFGGLVADFRCTKPDVLFKSGLRQHYLSPVRNSNDRWRGPDQTDYINWMTPKDQMAIKAAATRQRELTKRLSPHKVHTKYGDFGGMDMTFEPPSGSKTGRKPISVPQQARNLSHFERVALQK